MINILTSTIERIKALNNEINSVSLQKIYGIRLDITYQIIILFVVGSLAGFINVMAGGGSSLTLPVLIFLGLDPTTANGTNRVAIIIQNVSAVYSFKREDYYEFNESIKLSLFALPGSVIGAIVAVNIDDELFKSILAVIMILVVITMIIPRKKIETGSIIHKGRRWLLYLAMVGVGFYGGFIQVGVGFILMASLHYLSKLNLVYVNMHKVFIVLIYTTPALLVFVLSGNINWFLGLSLACGNAFGGWWAAKASVKKGEKAVRIVLVVAILIMAMKLLKLF